MTEVTARTFEVPTPAASPEDVFPTAGRGNLDRTVSTRAPRLSRLRPTAADVVVLVTCLSVAGFRFVVLARSGEPSGIDFGNWLTFGHAWLGDAVPGGSTSVYPPVIPLLAVIVASGVGAVHANWALAALLGVAPGLGVYGVLRASRLRWLAVGLALPVLAGSAAGEAVAWGGLPQLLGLFLDALCIWSMARLVAERSPRLGWTTGILLLATGATSHLIFTHAIVAGALILLAYAVTHRTSPRDLRLWGRSGWLATAGRVALPLLPLVPLYAVLLRTVGESFASGHDNSWTAVLASIETVFREAPWLWKAALVVSMTAVPLTWGARRDALWRCVFGLTGAQLALVALHPEPRLVYILPTSISIAIGLLFAPSVKDGKLRLRGPAMIGAVTIVVAGASYSGVSALRVFEQQHAFYSDDLMPPGTTAGLEWLRVHTVPAAVIATAPEQGIPFGWWVEGYARRATVVGSAQEFLNFPRERERARQADRLFDAVDLLGTANLLAARRAGVDYLVIPSGWDGLAQDERDQLLDDHPSLVAFRNDAIVVVAVPSQRSLEDDPAVAADSPSARSTVPAHGAAQ